MVGTNQYGRHARTKKQPDQQVTCRTKPCTSARPPRRGAPTPVKRGRPSRAGLSRRVDDRSLASPSKAYRGSLRKTLRNLSLRFPCESVRLGGRLEYVRLEVTLGES